MRRVIPFLILFASLFLGTKTEANYTRASQRYPANSGLVLYLRRAYDPTLQRFVNRDPISERGGMNLYGFVGNNPINFFDPFGFAPCPSLWDLWWLNMYENAGGDSMAFGHGLEMGLDSMMQGIENTIYDPFGSAYHLLGSQWSYLGALSGDPSGTLNNTWNGVVNSTTTAQGIGQLTFNLELALAMSGGLKTATTPVASGATYLDAGYGGFVDLTLAQKHSGLINVLNQGDKIMPSGSISANLMGELTAATGREVALFRVDGQRVLRLGGVDSFFGADASRVIAHTHPSGILQLSASDVLSFKTFQPLQKSTILVAPTGNALRLSIP